MNSCDAIQERLPELLSPPVSGDPEEAVLAPLREHVKSCRRCTDELAEMQAFLWFGKRAEANRESEQEMLKLAALAEAGRARFSTDLNRFRSADELGASEFDPGRYSGVLASARSAVGDLIRFTLTFPQVLLPQRVPLAAADSNDVAAMQREQLVEVVDTEGRFLAELLIAPTSSQLFVSTKEKDLQTVDLQVVLRLESRQAASMLLHLESGQATWDLPSHLVLEGACEIRIDVLEHTNPEP